MKLQKLFVVALVACAVISSCRKEGSGQNEPSTATSVAELQVPDGFDYKTNRVISYSFSTGTIWGKEKIRLDLYDSNPNSTGEIISTVFLNGYGKAEGEITVPSALKELYAVLTDPAQGSVTKKVAVTGNSVSYNFMDKKSSKKTLVISPDCNTGCGTVVNNSANWYTADGGGVYCFTGNTTSGINARNGSTVRICGTGSFQLSVESNARVEIVDGANVTITNFGINATADEVIIYPNATVNVTNWASPAGDVINFGTLTFANFGINAQCHFINNGSVDVTGTGWYTVDGMLTNNGSMSYAGNLTQNSSGSIINNCNLQVAKQLKLDALFENHGFVNIDQQLYINGSGTMKMFDGAMVKVEDIFMDGKLEGAGTTSLVKLNDQISGNSTARIQGNLELCDANGLEPAFAGQIVSPAVLDCDVYIPTNSCNSVGNGNPQILDDDADGVVNGLDAFPNDPTACAASFYPTDSTYATLLFEDLWPSQGDYDFNDLVMGYRHTMVTNSNNQVVRVVSNFVVKAIGGAYRNGFGFQLDVAPSVVSSITGQVLTNNLVTTAANGTEQNQTKATIIVFDNAYSTIRTSGGIFVNTLPTEPYKTSDTVEIVTTFNAPQTMASLGSAPFNPFIFINKDRGHELHLVDNPPTDLADLSYFNTGADNSNAGAGRFYRSENNHPWALNIDGNIRYMQEKLDFVQGYQFFSTWAESGGTQATDWYVDHVGYQDATKLY